MRRVYEGVGFAEAGPEWSAICLEDTVMTASGLVRGAGGEVVSESLTHAVEIEHSTDPYLVAARERRTHLSEYRVETGREFPRAYRMKITVELEELPEAEAYEFWRKRQGRE